MRFTLLFLVAYVLFQNALAFGDIKCRLDISFKLAPLEDGVKAEAAKEGEADAAADYLRTVFFSSIEAQAENEEAAKDALKRKAPIEKERALAECKKNYENNAGCIASKYTSMHAVLHTLDFKARSELQEAIKRDCSMQAGKCIEAVASEAVCVELMKAVEEKKSEESEAADTAKDKKAEKAKKADKGGGKKN